MNAIQLYSDMKEYFGKNGIKEHQSNMGLPYEEMYNEEYCNWLSHFYNCLLLKECDLQHNDIDELCEKVWEAQYEIETKLKEKLQEATGEL